ncbi:hypothetical protein KOAAANKH_00784 [Brevundimonas sp. NIBR10]|uniref:hypothetical protein n=1 Tax=Brevundimonas sp. NIBR10 TaxID=3015997 RepID=UPI0022F18EB8|nr:hypothetical protein [Brevundimonas sp. NIBR10]WGM45919.1 hypothetical protein KOAAANKH_00784 [Brevundimonas sp. NIBR10]
MLDMEKTAARENASPAPRRRGRPLIADQTSLTKMDVFERGLQIARTTALQDITITEIARALDVTPAMIHYLITSREGLISGVMNAFYQRLSVDWPEPAGNWREHLVAVSHHVRRYYVEYRGVVLYIGAHNRHRVVQQVEVGETDYGLVFLDRLFQAAMRMRLDAHHTVLFCETLIEFLSAQARAAIVTRLPRAHEPFLRGVFDKLDPEAYPGIAFASDELFQTDHETLFEQGLSMMMDAFEIRRAKLI